jgi:hypothetical protein
MCLPIPPTPPPPLLSSGAGEDVVDFDEEPESFGMEGRAARGAGANKLGRVGLVRELCCCFILERIDQDKYKISVIILKCLKRDHHRASSPVQASGSHHG